MKEYYVALIGLLGVIIGGLISGLFQNHNAKRNAKMTMEQFEKQYTQSQKQFAKQLEQSEIELSFKLEQIKEEQRRVAVEKATESLHAENTRFYANVVREMQCYDRLHNELNYLNNATAPRSDWRQRRIDNHLYPHIDNNIVAIVGDIELPQNIATLLGALRNNIALYNAAVDAQASCDCLEELLTMIHSLIDPINEERFVNYANSQKLLREHEVSEGHEQLKQLS